MVALPPQATPRPPFIGAQFSDRCNLSATSATRKVLFMYGFAQAPTEDLQWPHFIIVVCILGCLQPLGALLNFITLGTLCKDSGGKRNSITILLQALIVFDIFYLGAHFTGVFLPAFFQTISNASYSCIVSDVAKVRVQENDYFEFSTGMTRDLVNWQLILLSEYCLIPYCCWRNTAGKLYNKCFAIFETIVVFTLVAMINTFLFFCKSMWAHKTITEYAPFVEIFNVLFPYGCIVFMCIGIIVMLIADKLSRRHTWNEHELDQLYRGLSAILLFVICETPYVVHWIMRWNLGQSLSHVFGYYMIAYIGLGMKHINCSIKLMILCAASREFRKSLGRSCRGEEDHYDDHHYDDHEYGEKAHEDDRLMYHDEDDLSDSKRNHFLEVSQV